MNQKKWGLEKLFLNRYRKMHLPTFFAIINFLLSHLPLFFFFFFFLLALLFHATISIVYVHTNTPKPCVHTLKISLYFQEFFLTFFCELYCRMTENYLIVPTYVKYINIIQLARQQKEISIPPGEKKKISLSLAHSVTLFQ